MSYSADGKKGRAAESASGVFEAIGLGAIAIAVMALLVFGYNVREPSQTAQVTKELSGPASAEQPMSNPPLPRANPAEKSEPPTSSTTPPSSGEKK